METFFEETPRFLRDVKKIDGQGRLSLEKAVNRVASREPHHLPTPSAHRIPSRAFGVPLTSSLYVERVTSSRRLIFTDEVDPLRDERVIRLLRYTTLDEASRAVREIHQRLLAELADPSDQVDPAEDDGEGH